MAAQLIITAYQGIEVAFTEDAWFNATAVAAGFKKEVYEWLRLPTTKEYLETLSDVVFEQETGGGFRTGKIPVLKTPKQKSPFVKVKRGGKGGSDATWFHPELAVAFARWLDVRFAIWCDRFIKAILMQQHPRFDWKRCRHEAASSYKLMSASLQLHRTREGKEVKQHHFSNEARLVNWALVGEFKGLDRDALPYDDLDLLAKLEVYNSVLIGEGQDYTARKLLLEHFAKQWRAGMRSNSIAAMVPERLIQQQEAVQ